jgi:hypothetical protein
VDVQNDEAADYEKEINPGVAELKDPEKNGWSVVLAKMFRGVVEYDCRGRDATRRFYAGELEFPGGRYRAILAGCAAP